MVSPQAPQGGRIRRPRRYDILLLALPERCNRHETSLPDVIHTHAGIYFLILIRLEFLVVSSRALGHGFICGLSFLNNLNVNFLLQFQWIPRVSKILKTA